MSSLAELTQDAIQAAEDLNPLIETDGVSQGCYRTLNLIELPDVMQQTGRPVGATLMRKWFSKVAFAMPDGMKSAQSNYCPIPNEAVENNLISMKWALNFTRAYSAYLDLRNIISGKNPDSFAKSKQRLFNLLLHHNKFQKSETSFGDIKLSTSEIYRTANINFRPVSTKVKEQVLDPTDDLYCALGAFNIYLAASGKIKPINNGKTTHEIHIEKFGFFIRDTYDFNGFQPLGFWSREGVSKVPGKGYSYVGNNSFRDWRSKHHKGGDFIVFSDVLWESLRIPLIWKYPY